MGIVFIDEGESNRAIIAKILYDHISQKKKGLPKVRIATTGKNKSLHMKGLKAIKELGLDIKACSRKNVNKLEKLDYTDKTYFIVLGRDNDKKKIKDTIKTKNLKFWTIDNPLNECKNEVKLRFFRRVRDQLWVNIENLIDDLAK